jgi:very-short-patch-repair endonuclease
MRSSQPWLTNRSRVLRSQLAAAEAKLWDALRDRQLGGFKFVRQAAIGPYFADFTCRERKFIVEVDGATHGSDEEMAADARRTAALERMGYRVYRVTNDDVARNLEGTLESILHELEKLG